MEATPSREYSAIDANFEKNPLFQKQLSEQLLEVQTDKEEETGSSGGSNFSQACIKELTRSADKTSLQVNPFVSRKSRA